MAPVRVAFRGDASSVQVAGDFSAGGGPCWEPRALSRPGGRGEEWEVELELAPGCYPYRLLVDGQWTLAPGADTEPGRDGPDSLLIVEEQEGDQENTEGNEDLDTNAEAEIKYWCSSHINEAEEIEELKESAPEEAVRKDNVQSCNPDGRVGEKEEDAKTTERQESFVKFLKETDGIEPKDIINNELENDDKIVTPKAEDEDEMKKEAIEAPVTDTKVADMWKEVVEDVTDIDMKGTLKRTKEESDTQSTDVLVKMGEDLEKLSIAIEDTNESKDRKKTIDIEDDSDEMVVVEKAFVVRQGSRRVQQLLVEDVASPRRVTRGLLARLRQ